MASPLAFAGKTPAVMSIAEARALAQAQLQSIVETEEVEIGAARGRVLAQDLVAASSLPPHDCSAVDGYAIRHADRAESRRIKHVLHHRRVEHRML